MGLKLALHGVHVTNIRFGFVETKMAKASFKPLMITAEKAAQHVLKCLETRPRQFSTPKVLGGALHVMRWVQSVRIWAT